MCDFPEVHWIFFGKKAFMVLTSGALGGNSSPQVPTFHGGGGSLQSGQCQDFVCFFMCLLPDGDYLGQHWKQDILVEIISENCR